MTKRRIHIIIIFIVYLYLIASLLFLDRVPQDYYDYNLVPFKIIKLWYNLIVYDSEVYFWYALENLLGNIILFIPIGIFVPYIFPKQENYLIFTLTIISCVSLSELLQFITKYGTGDIDDVILNTAGALIGLVIYKTYFKVKHIKKG